MANLQSFKFEVTVKYENYIKDVLTFGDGGGQSLFENQKRNILFQRGAGESAKFNYCLNF